MAESDDPYGAGAVADGSATPKTVPKAIIIPTADDPYGTVQANPRPPTPPPDQPAQQQSTQPASFLDRAFTSILGRVTQAPSPPAALAQPSVPFEEPHSTAGIRRGVEDVWDTGRRVVSDVTGGDTDALRQAQQARIDQYNQEHGTSFSAGLGRIAGQTLATAPLLGGAGRLIGGAVGGLSSVAPGVANAVGPIIGTTQAGSTLGRIGQLAVQGAGAGAGQAALTGDNPVTGAAVGGAVGPVVGAATKVVDAARGLTGGVDPAMAQLGQKALDIGVTPPLASMADTPTMRIIGAQARELPFSGATTQTQDVQRTVQGQLLDLMGKPGSTQMTPAVVQDALDTAGKQIGNIAQRTTITADKPLIGDIGSIRGDYGAFGLDPSQQGKVEGPIRNILAQFTNGNGRISGQQYQTLTQSGGPLDTLMNSNDTALAQFGRRVRTALDDVFQRSAAPGDQTALTLARQQYRLGKTLEPLAAKSTTGDIPMPSALGRLAQEYGVTGGTGDYRMTGLLGDVARVGAQFGKPEVQSGTGPRSMVLNALQHPLGLLLSAGPLLGPNWALQKALNSRATVENLINTSLNPALIPSTSRAIPAGVGATVSAADNLRGLGGAGY